MAIRSRKPTSPGRRFQTSHDFARSPRPRRRSRCSPRSRSTGGRNAYGRKTSRHRGGGHKQQYRIIDFKRTKDGVVAKVAAIEYDPNRTCRIALLHYLDGEKALHPRSEEPERGRPHHVGSGLGHQARQRDAAALHPGRYHRPQRRAPPGRRRQDRPLGRHVGAPGRQGRRLRNAAYALHRDAPSARSTAVQPSARSATPSTSSSRSARPDATAGRASARRPVVSP